jgi:hypothetical protein
MIGSTSERRPIMSNLKMRLALGGLIAAVSLSAWADLPGRHPGYLHALSDLRAARWLLSHQAGDAKVYGDEDVAITEIDAAIGELKKASIDDGKNLNDHPNVDTPEHGSRLLKSMEALHKAHQDISGEEDDPEVRGLRDRAIGHVDRAIQAADKAHAAWLKDKH